MPFRSTTSKPPTEIPPHLSSSPTITICLRHPSPTTQTERSTSDRETLLEALGPSRKRSRTVTEAAAESPNYEAKPFATRRKTVSGTDPDEDPPTFTLPVEALIAQSLYFKGLISFAGLETTQNKVDFECPSLYDRNLNKVAFQCFVDFLYTGTYYIDHYNFHRRFKYKRRCTGEEVIFLALLYVLGERLLAEDFQKLVLLDMYSALILYQRTTEIPFDERDSVEREITSSLSWSDLGNAIKIVYDGTPLKPARLPVPTTLQSTLPNPHAKLHPLKSRERISWLGGDPMRNLMTAFLANRWDMPVTTESEVIYKIRIVEDDQEVMKALLSWLLVPKDVRRLEWLPGEDLGVGVVEHVVWE